ncbi:MAG: carbohydrate-binding family 9-like protein [Myxococcaceae bacterium]
MNRNSAYVLVAWTVALPLLLVACKDEQAGPGQRSPSATAGQAAPALAEDPKDLSFRSDATFGEDAIRYLGSRVVALARGVELHHFFRVNKAPPQGFDLFVHLVHPETGELMGNVDHALALPQGQWPVGRVLEDVHTVALPPGVVARVMLGFWRQNERLLVAPAAAQDGQRRAFGPRIGTESPVPEYRVARVNASPRIDGVLDEPVWKSAARVPLVNSLTGQPARAPTFARLLHDGSTLYVAFECQDADVWGTFRKPDSPIYNEEVVELFLDPDGDERDYYEVEVSPHNVVFDASFAARRKGMNLPFSAQLKSAVQVRGTLDDAKPDEGWTVEFAMPLAGLKGAPVPIPAGHVARFNLYRIEHHQRRHMEGLAFSPPRIGDFHHLARFGKLIFE